MDTPSSPRRSSAGPGPTDDEHPLSGGNASGPVVRVGDTVRKPWLGTTARVAGYLDHLAEQGLDVPRVRGRDEQGRAVIDFVPGRMVIEVAPLPVGQVRRVGALLRRIHDASASFAWTEPWPVLLPAPDDLPGEPLACHNDVATWNLVLDGQRLVLIDWDGAGPSTRLWDLVYAAVSFAHTFPDADPAGCAGRLSALAEGYRADDELRRLLPSTMTRRAHAMWQHLVHARATGWQPWARMHDEGHGEHWRLTTVFLDQHQGVWEAALRR